MVLRKSWWLGRGLSAGKFQAVLGPEGTAQYLREMASRRQGQAWRAKPK